jgi:hypothetical protein
VADKLAIYNMALAHLGERKVTLTENREPRRVLDDFWEQEVSYCLERKFWNFTYRTIQIDASTSTVPTFGYAYAFPIPADWIRTRAISASERLTPPLLAFAEEAGYWYADVTPLYVQFNSSDPAYGRDLSLWPASFVDYVAKRLARQACNRITGKSDRLDGPTGLIRQEEKAYKVAAANCAMNEPIRFAPQSGWVSARRRGFGSSGDNPSGGSLIG